MNRNKRNHILYAALGIIIFHLLPFNSHAQSFSYRTFDISSGLPGEWLNALGQDKEGFLWVGLETGLFRFDGFDFYEINLPDTLTKGYPCAIDCDKTGAMWIGYTDGSLYKWSQGNEPVRQNIEAEKISRILTTPDDKIWIITQTDGIFTSGTSATDKIEKMVTPEVNIFDVAFLGEDSLLVATENNIYICKIRNDEIINLKPFPEFEYIGFQTLASLPGRKWVAGATDGSGLFIISEKNGVFTTTSVKGIPSLEGARISSILADSDNTLFVATLDAGMVKIKFNDDYSAVLSFVTHDVESGLSENAVKTIFKDREGNLWIGLFNLGLSAVTTNAFSFFSPVNDKEINYIGESQGRVLMGTRNGLYDYDPTTGTFSNYRELNKKTGGSGITSWKALEDGGLLIGTSKNGLWLLNRSGVVRQFWHSMNPGRNNINGIDSDDENIWLATMDGVVLLDKKTGIQKRVFTTDDRLPRNDIAQVVTAGKGEVLAALESDKLQYINAESGVRTSELAMEGVMRNKIQSISLHKKDSIVCVGTLGNGIFRITPDEVMNLMTYDGLFNDYCYSILLASDGRIWSGHQRGFSIVDTKAGFIRTFSRDFGVKGACQPNAITETSDGHIYIGTTEGVIAYDPKMEKTESVPPQAVIISVKINDVEYPYKEFYSLPYKKTYTVQVNYGGISLSDPLNVTYRVKLDNYNFDWKSTESRSQTYENMRDGQYHFTVEASAKDNIKEVTKASFDISIQKPVFRRWWFIMAMIALAIGILYVIILLRERASKKQREYLESELSKRTAEVHQQKEELFQKNQDITESIKYAKRIQSSVLPDVSRLSTIFSDSFVFFLPRDIVSGDFFWFDWVDKDRFVVVCADSTGHGVPGAFMSMIGTALLQDIVTRKKIAKPSEILHELDKRIFSTLNQNQEVEAANDGMDIVVCEFNTKTRHLVFASAMRPVVLIIDGEQQYIRGNRSAVGGESASEKFFDDQEYHLREGDAIYLFSDGYPDQFGGPYNKKMKISRLRTLMEEMKSLPMTEQKEKLSDYFFDWKGDNDQIDDVLVMGIRF